jgi:hypothetical protein
VNPWVRTRGHAHHLWRHHVRRHGR